jgi:hypothetical protein
MRNEPPVPLRGSPAAPAIPRCAFVTGSRGSGKTRWLQLQIRDIAREHPGASCGVVLAEEGRTRMERFSQETPGVSVRRLLLPCTCCPGLADLPGALREMVEAVQPGWVFLEVPSLAAAGFMAEFDRLMGWPRELAVCLDRGWTTALLGDSLSPFQMALLGLADRVVPSLSPVGLHPGVPGAPGPVSSHDPA